MALDDTQEAALKAELEANKAELVTLKADAAKQIKEGKVKESDPGEEKPRKPKVDPDTVKTIAELTEKVSRLEKRLGSESKSDSGTWFQLPD